VTRDTNRICDRWNELLELWTRVMKLLQKDQLYVELYRVYLSVIIVHLFRNDYVAADRAYAQFVRYALPN
jgi:hypothetical protein